MMATLRHIFTALATLLAAALVNSCIQPPLVLPAEEVIVEDPMIIIDIEVDTKVDPEWRKDWCYGWDALDEELFGSLEYPEPKSFEIRRYFLGDKPAGKHTEKEDRTINNTSTYRDNYRFGYYDLLFWSKVVGSEGEQVLLIDESDLEDVKATTSVTHSINLKGQDGPANALYNQPEIIYSAYPRDIYISHYKEDYDYYDEATGVWVKKIKETLTPIVYMYLVQIILENNDGRVKDVSGDCAISAFANATSVNTGHTSSEPCLVYFNSRMKKDLDYKGKNVDIIGAKFTTFGLPDTDRKAGPWELPNFLYYELRMASGAILPMTAEVSLQCQAQPHGGVITIVVDCNDIDDPGGHGGSIFNPTVDDYEELEYEIPLG